MEYVPPANHKNAEAKFIEITKLSKECRETSKITEVKTRKVISPDTKEEEIQLEIGIIEFKDSGRRYRTYASFCIPKDLIPAFLDSIGAVSK